MAETIQSIEDIGGGKYRITYAGGSISVVNSAEAKTKAKESGIKIAKESSSASLPSLINQGTSSSFANPAATPSTSVGNPIQRGAQLSGQTVPTTAYASNNSDAFNIVDPSTGVPINASLMVPTAQGPKPISQLILEAKFPKNYSTIKKALIDYNQVTKGTKSSGTIENAWTKVLVNSAISGLDPFEYLKQLQKYGGGLDTTAQAGFVPQQSVWAPDKAQSFITDQYRSNLHRDPTAEELDKDSKSLIKEQEKYASASKQEYVNVKEVINGKTVTKKVLRNITGLDEGQWFAKKISKTPEYQNIQKQIATAANQQLSSIAAANGITLTPQQMSDFGKRIATGENPDVIKAVIREQAALGQPENVKKLLGQGLNLADVYQPYKTAMAKTLEIDPNAISLDDPILRSAFTPTGEQTLYDFQRSLRKDPRWQYTDNARGEVADSVTKVLQDFGFKG
jgi:hypothetical protein